MLQCALEEVLVLTSLPRSHVHDIAEISTAFSSDGNYFNWEDNKDYKMRIMGSATFDNLPNKYFEVL